jgi:predicted nuclease of predicted toxin-antitoxin system
MKFLLDAQLPRRFASWLKEAGHDALHILDLPKKNLTPDNELVARAMQDGALSSARMLISYNPLWLRVSRRCC